jgi:hypothetical protein
LLIERLNRNIEAQRLESRLLEHSQRQSDSDRLVAEFIAGNKKNRSMASQGGTYGLRLDLIIHEIPRRLPDAGA